MKKKIPEKVTLKITGTKDDFESFQKVILVAEYFRLDVEETSGLLNLKKAEGKRIITAIQKSSKAKRYPSISHDALIKKSGLIIP